MTFTKLSDDFSDDCWQLSDGAFRLHVEALVWAGRRLLDCRIPKADLRHFKGGEPAAIQELLNLGFWSDYGDSYLILHHSQYQRTRESVVAQQTQNRLNGKRGGRRPSGGAREIWPRSEPAPQTKSGTESKTESESESGTQMGLGGFQAEQGPETQKPRKQGAKKPVSVSESKTEREWPLAGSSTSQSSSVVPVSGSAALDPYAWPTDDFGIYWRALCDEKGLETVPALMESERMALEQAAKCMRAAYPGRRF